jgi:hypothetical protein
MTDDITKELAETLRELRTKFDAREHLSPSMVRVDAVLDRYNDACKTPEPQMTTNYPFTPPPELVEQWYSASPLLNLNRGKEVAIRAAQWGADQELEACIEWLVGCIRWEDAGEMLRKSRRSSQPPSLKEQALATLQKLSKDGYPCNYQDDADWDTIRHALETLPE